MWGFWSESRAIEAPRPTSSRKSTVWGTNVVFTGCALGTFEPHAASHSSPRTSATDGTLFDTARHPNSGLRRGRAPGVRLPNGSRTHGPGTRIQRGAPSRRYLNEPWTRESDTV